jgi:heme/copper-type cytochrome/quinol oxidase subunit 2
MNSLVHWFAINSTVLAVLVTVGVAVLLVCCLQCSNCSKREKDDLFRRREL